MADARISTALPSHPKTKKLMRRLGGVCGGWYLVRLFLWVAENRSNGDLSGMTDEDIELAVDFDGEEGALISALCDVGFIDGEQGARVIHDWEEHNPWAAGADARSLKAKWNAMKRHHGEQAADKAYPEYAAIRPKRDNDQHATSTNTAQNQEASSSAPSPSPSIKEEDKSSLSTAKLPDCPHLEILALFAKNLPELPQPKPELWDGQRAKNLAARWKWLMTTKNSKTGLPYAVDKETGLDWFDRFFGFVAQSDFLTGRNGQWSSCDLSWLIKAENFAKVIQGNYHKA